jgi:hypothetical protein
MDLLIPYDQEPAAIEALILTTLEGILQREGGLPLRTLFSKACHIVDGATQITKRGQNRSVVSYLKSQRGGGGAKEFILAHPESFTAPHDFASNNQACVTLRLALATGASSSSSTTHLPTPAVASPPQTADLSYWVGKKLCGQCVFWNKGKGWGKIAISGLAGAQEVMPPPCKTTVFMHAKWLKGNTHLLCSATHLSKGQSLLFEAGMSEGGKGLEVVKIDKLGVESDERTAEEASCPSSTGTERTTEEDISSRLENVSFGRKSKNFVPRQLFKSTKAPGTRPALARNAT